MFDFDTCNDARLRRDPAFDGLFFTAVRTTGIYCRPVCPVKQPLTRNVSYYPSAAAALWAGFGPCLGCGRESAPFCVAWNVTLVMVLRVFNFIAYGALYAAPNGAPNGNSVEALAERLGVGARHLARLFERHVGASPLQTAKTLRLQRAKCLLNDTDLSMTDIAFQAGFGSVRRFNAAFADLYGRPPSALRKQKALHASHA